MGQQKNPAKVSVDRMLRMLKRQKDVLFGASYTPAIMAVREEAPSLSNAYTIWSVLQHRDVHALSWPEAVAFSLAMYARPLDLHEQHVYYPWPCLHPLAFHPTYSNLVWPETEGTFVLAERLGLKKFHPKFWVPVENEESQRKWKTGAFIGDLFLYMRGPDGRPYLRAWEVKARPEDHYKTGGGSERRPRKEDAERVMARRSICSAYVEQLGTSLTDFHLEMVPEKLQHSLFHLCTKRKRPYELDPMLEVELLCAFQEGVGQDMPAREIAAQVASRPNDIAAAKILLDHAVWERKVRVDLLEPLIWSEPLLPEREDILVRFAHLFDPVSVPVR